MSIPTARPEVIPVRPLDDPIFASHAHSRSLSSGGSAISTAPLTQGIKRKASYAGVIEPSWTASRPCPPIKLEQSSPKQFNFGGSSLRDTRSEFYEMPTGYVNSLSSDDREDQTLDSHQVEGTITMDSSETQLAPAARLDMWSKDMSVPSKYEARIDPTTVPLRNSDRGTNGFPASLVRDNLPPPHQQKASIQPKRPRHSSGSNIGDVAYSSVPDYSPPISSLHPGNVHIFQVHWRQKTFVDLSIDPDRHMLHEAEVQLAMSLNMSCAKYLCTKRRIFQTRLKALQEGREFKKSDSIKACKINSNKASKICGVFEKIGWFDQKYFLGYLDKSNGPLMISNGKSKDGGSVSSGLTELDIWDVSESEFHFTSEGDEESTDDDTAGSSVSFDGTHDETQWRKSLNSYSDPLPGKNGHGVSPIEGDSRQRRAVDDGTVRTSNTLPRNEAVYECPTTEDSKQRRGLVLQETVYPRKPDSLSTDNFEEFTVLETRSMTQKMKVAQNRHAQDQSISCSTMKTKHDQQKSTLKESAAPTKNNYARTPIPHSLDEADAADIMLVKMKEKCRPWLEIEQAWEKKTGRWQSSAALSTRYTRIMANLASTRLVADKKPDKVCSITYPRLQSDSVSDNDSISHPKLSSLEQDQLLVAAEAEVEETFQREKAEILAEIESNFQSEKWNLVAEAMSRTRPATYSAELIQAQYERLTKKPKGAAAKYGRKENTFTPRAVEGGKIETSTTSRSGAGRLGEASNVINLPRDGGERGQKTGRKAGPKNHEEHSAIMRKVWAKRRALGTNGHHGGPPKASTAAKDAKIAVSLVTPNTETSLAPSVISQNDHAPDSFSNQTQTIVLEEKVGGDANQHKQSLAQIIPATAPVDSEPKHKKPPRKVSMYQNAHGTLADRN